MSQNEQYLKIISIFHYVVGAMAALFACFPIVHFIVGIGMLFAGVSQPSTETLPFLAMGVFFTLFAGGIILFGWAFAICLILAGRFIAARTHYMFCLVMAGVACMFMPFGTVLGVFTIILLIQPPVKELFQEEATKPITETM